jgi:dihydrofolate reductase
MIYTGASVSLDGYIAGPGESGFDLLFQWYANGDVELTSTHPEIPFKVTEVSAKAIQTMREQTGVFVVGRRLFDITNGWDGSHPHDIPIVVLTHNVPEDWRREHPGAPFTFVTDGLERALDVAREIAGDKHVGVNGGTIATQCLDARVLDEVWPDLVPVVLGAGVPFLAPRTPFSLEGPLSVAQGNRVTHLRYRVNY